MYVFIILME